MSVALVSLAYSVEAKDLEGLVWSEQKCILREIAVDATLDFRGRDGLRTEFLTWNQSFRDCSCQALADVRQITDAEPELGNLLTIMTMNGNIAITSVPFKCS